MTKCLSKGVGRTGSWTIQILEILMWIYVLTKYFPNTIKKHSKPASMQKKKATWSDEYFYSWSVQKLGERQSKCDTPLNTCRSCSGFSLLPERDLQENGWYDACAHMRDVCSSLCSRVLPHLRCNFVPTAARIQTHASRFTLMLNWKR